MIAVCDFLDEVHVGVLHHDVEVLHGVDGFQLGPVFEPDDLLTGYEKVVLVSGVEKTLNGLAVTDRQADRYRYTDIQMYKARIYLLQKARERKTKRIV